ncbi:MAG: hypothetical protein WC760_08780 [Bacteroidia bacterium]
MITSKNSLCMLLMMLMMIFSIHSDARESINAEPVKKGGGGSPDVDPRLMKSAGCLQGTQKVDLDVNNVRATILNGGDMWWDLSNAKYEIPKVQSGQVSKNSLFAGALWIGGVVSGNLRIAAQTYRQNGNDYYPGPLTVGTASIDAATCETYDKIYKVTLLDINRIANDPAARATVGDDIKLWPGTTTAGGQEKRFLAPFWDENGDGNYNIDDGDYPSFDHNVNLNIPDMMLFIVYNDKGNLHTETYGAPIGLELQTMCFAYSTNDAINNMTFYRTVVYNMSNETIDSCIFGQWVDPDLGNYSDDYVECDVDRNLGICYNGDDDDEGILGYGLNPPSIGVNFFSGPSRINHDSTGAITDTTEIGLTKFVYYNNDNTQQGNPSRPTDYWNYLNGRWRDGTNITYGGNGKGGADTASYMFPGSTDPANRAEWTERISQNQPGDRRFLQTAGTFSLLPGARNTVTIGVVWARAAIGGATGSFSLLKQASDKAAILFRNNFKIVAGPDAPKLEIVELDRQLVVKIVKTDTIESFNSEFAGACTDKTNYKFQGYQIFQVKTQNVPGDFYDLSQARLIAQFDLVDGVTRLVNSVNDPDLGEDVKKIMVSGTDNGIKHSFSIKEDAFSTSSDKALSNFSTYYYVILSYAYATNCSTDPSQYLPGRKTIDESELKVYSGIPHDPSSANNGTKLNAGYGDGFPVTQLEGMGNGGFNLELKPELIQEALSAANNYKSSARTYMPGYGPIAVKVIDPLKVPNTSFILWLRDTTANGKRIDTLSDRTNWFLKNVATGEVIQGNRTIGEDFEQIFPQWGISVQLRQAIMPGDAESKTDLSNGYITSSVDWHGSSVKWLSNVSDEDPVYSNYIPFKNVFNWIRSGKFGTPDFKNGEADDYARNIGTSGQPVWDAVDPRKNFAKILNGTWSPYCLASRWRTLSSTTFPTFGPAWDGTIGSSPGAGTFSEDNDLPDLHSVNFVITPDKSLWTRCVVVETGEYSNLNQGKAEKMEIRLAPSVDKNGIPTGADGCNEAEAQLTSASGMGWFPGYAVDIETGERLNLMFGEDSSLPGENGNDMIWNPTSNVLDRNTGRPVFGGKHYVYVMSSTKFFTVGAGSSLARFNSTRYDEGRSYICCMDLTCNSVITSAIPVASKLVRKRFLFSQVMWTSMPMMTAGSTLSEPRFGLVPGTITYKFRVKRPYANFAFDATTINDSMPYFTFNTADQAPAYSAEYGKRALDKVSIVPNPYYAYSPYEDPGNQLDVRVRITNLPPRCSVHIYTLEGTLVRTIIKDDPSSAHQEWDLKNNAKVPISSGVYLIHVKAPDLGEERIIKWFGVMRPADYDTF